ncbi:nedd4-like ubiquitin [Plasmopara halstedii]|uniref:HECT-type E3 ubiquitin transferase n=1 Tax=Plasmopara halstedii TaxID=4781 RepID=A0A0P1AW93_PLAHL|nr:nedd4-like ubiquitin [Plasmopara halstedii]CEG45708.1 nedd4-like ubiquitin [Plasmopara halstedii]|eukprot:XP_024582077.1 nedd4-like ubiquitin [Plasmopara halstedii]
MIFSTEQMEDLRMIAAQREAVEGSATCVSCGFENFASLVYCALCGLPSSFTSNLMATASPQDDTLGHDNPLSCVMKRQEWTREIDANCKMVWRRKVEESEHSTTYVLRFYLSPEFEPEPDREASKQRERSLSSGYDPCAGIRFELLEPHDTESTLFPLPAMHPADLPDTMEDLRQIAMELATQDLSRKYAHFIASATSLLQVKDRPLLSKLTVSRDNIFEQSIQHIIGISHDSIRSVCLQVNFNEQENLWSDKKYTGSLHREWLTLLSEKLLDSSVGLFYRTQISNPTFFINSQSERVLGVDHLQYFQATGRLVGRALLDGAVLNFHLCSPLLKMMLGVPIAFNDLECLDPDMFRQLTRLLDNDGAELLELDFTVTHHHCNQTRVVELIPTGRNIQVNDDNKFEFADRKFRYLMFESVAPQLASFLKGFYELVPQRMLLPFDHEELDYLLCGSDEINVQDWQFQTHLALEVRREVTWFWDVVKEMSRVYQLRLLQFATGYLRVPLVGFQGLRDYNGQVCKFTLTDASNNATFRAHAHYNTLELPYFKTKDNLRMTLYAALYDEKNIHESKVL